MTKPIALTNSSQRVPLSVTKFKLTTPKLLKVGVYATWGASLLLLVTTISSVQGQRNAFQTIGKDSAPSILNAQRIKDSLADLDANAANELLVKSGENPQAVKGYNDRREKLATLLVNAANNITYGDEERQPIETIIAGLNEYVQKIQQARDANASGDTTALLAAYREATKIIDDRLLPAADALDKVNSNKLEDTYARERFAAGRSLFLTVMSGFLLIGILVGIQLFLNYRMRRVFNPMLLAATAIATIFLGYTSTTLLTASEHLRGAKEDAFVSLYALRQARASAYIANGSESRYLLDKTYAAKHQKTFFNYTGKIASISNPDTFETVATAAADGKEVPGFTGFLANELNNITFEGEREAAVEMLRKFGVYINLDKQIRQLEQSGNHAAAIALCTGYEKGQSNWAFEELKKAHDEVLYINEHAFKNAIAEGFTDLKNYEVISSIAVVSIALFTLLGLLPRMKEYEI